MKLFFCSLHILWGAFGVYASYVTATATSGHPPGIIFLPVALLVWGIGHFILWFMHKMANHSDSSMVDTESTAKKSWPASVLIVALMLGLVFAGGIFMGFAVLFNIIFSQNMRLGSVASIAILWLPFALGFIGLLRRKLWSRYAISGASLLLAGLYLFRIMISISRSTRSIDLNELLIVLGIELTLLTVGIWALRSTQLNNFLRFR